MQEEYVCRWCKNLIRCDPKKAGNNLGRITAGESLQMYVALFLASELISREKNEFSREFNFSFQPSHFFSTPAMPARN